MTARQDSEEEQPHGGAARFRQAVEASAIGIAFWGADGTLSDANDSFLAITGYTRADVAAGVVNWRPMMTGIPDAGVCPLRKEEFARADGYRFSSPMSAWKRRLSRASPTSSTSARRGGPRSSRDKPIKRRPSPSLPAASRMISTIPKEPLHEMAALIEEAAQRGADLARRLLAVARRQPLRPQAVDVHGLAAGLLERLRGTLGDAIAIEFAGSRDLRRAMADPAALEAAILDLVTNACDAMPDDGRLLIEADNARIDPVQARQLIDVAPGQHVTIAVTDTGTGMTAERWRAARSIPSSRPSVAARAGAWPQHRRGLRPAVRRRRRARQRAWQGHDGYDLSAGCRSILTPVRAATRPSAACRVGLKPARAPSGA